MVGRRLYIAFLITLCLCLGCTNSNKEAQQEFVDCCRNYIADVAVAHQTFIDRANNDVELVRQGEITTAELRQRYFLNLYAYANVLSFIDHTPRYAALIKVLLGDDALRVLAPLPNNLLNSDKLHAQYESYLESFIDYHIYVIVAKISDYLETNEHK